VEGSCEHGNELSGSIKCREFLEYPHGLCLPKKGSAPWNWLVSLSSRWLNYSVLWHGRGRLYIQIFSVRQVVVWRLFVCMYINPWWTNTLWTPICCILMCGNSWPGLFATHIPNLCYICIYNIYIFNHSKICLISWPLTCKAAVSLLFLHTLKYILLFSSS
jgi:hypothetical protein